MENDITDQALPKLFYAVVLSKPQGYEDDDKTDEDFKFDFKGLSLNAYLDFIKFIYVHSDDEGQLTFLIHTDISVINEFQLYLSKTPLSQMDIEVRAANNILLNGEFLSLEFWKEFNRELKDDWPLNEKQKNLLEDFIKEHTTVMDIIDKINNIGKENLHQIELEILNQNQVSCKLHQNCRLQNEDVDTRAVEAK